MVSLGSIDEKIQEVLDEKKKLSNSLVENNQSGREALKVLMKSVTKAGR